MSVYKINAKVANNGVKALKSRRTCWNCLNGNPRLPEYTVITHGCSDLTQKPRRSHQSGNINCPQDPIKKKARQVHRNTPTSHPTLSHTHTHGWSCPSAWSRIDQTMCSIGFICCQYDIFKFQDISWYILCQVTLEAQVNPGQIAPIPSIQFFQI